MDKRETSDDSVDPLLSLKSVVLSSVDDICLREIERGARFFTLQLC